MAEQLAQKQPEESQPTFLSFVESESGQKLTNCYQCQKCTAGCPVAYVADYTVSQLVRMIQMNQESKVVSSSMVWLCTSCGTCGARCPNDINMALAMDVIRQHILRDKKAEIKEERISDFHTAFMEVIEKKGRLNEINLMRKYLSTVELLSKSNFGMGVSMIRRGKLRIIPEKVKRIKEIRKLFEDEK